MKLKISRVVKQWNYADKIFPAKDGFITNNFGSGRRFSICNNPVFRNEAFKEFGLIPELEEPIFQNFTGNHYLDGAFVHKHTDPAPDGYVHTRCNLMIQKPLEGGNPVIDEEELNVCNGDLWICLASLETHSSTPIKGGERFIFSFGSLILYKKIKEAILA
jgi:hypothetical protein